MAEQITAGILATWPLVLVLNCIIRLPTNFLRCPQGPLIINSIPRALTAWNGVDLGPKLQSPSQAYDSMKTKLSRYSGKKMDKEKVPRIKGK